MTNPFSGLDSLNMKTAIRLLADMPEVPFNAGGIGALPKLWGKLHAEIGPFVAAYAASDRAAVDRFRDGWMMAVRELGDQDSRDIYAEHNKQWLAVLSFLLNRRVP